MRDGIVAAFTGGTTRLAITFCFALALAVSSACREGGDERTPGADASFTLGVASGDVTTSSAVLWTRAEGGDRVVAEVAEDDAFERIVTTAEASTSADQDYTLNVRVELPRAATRYYYRFRAGGSTSETGAFITAAGGRTATSLRFVLGGDSDGTRKPDGSPPYNEFEVLEAAAREDPAFFLYFGDTIYADREPNATTLDGYRAKYRENRGYGALRRILAATSIYTMWDDHEVVNDFAGTTVDRAMFEAGRQAFREYFPMAGETDDAPLYRSSRYDADLELFILDERSYRSESAASVCTNGENPDPIPGAALPAAPDAVRALRSFVGLSAEPPAGCLDTMEDASRTMLGAEQKAWFKEALRRSTATWKVIVNSVPVQMLLALPFDRWEGYAAERAEMLEFIRSERIQNVVFLTTDFHASIFGPVRLDLFDEEAPPVAYEAVFGPIATDPLQQDVVDVLGETGAGLLQPFFTGITKVDCADLNSYAYGVVSISGATMSIEAKDQTGRTLCAKSLEATP